MACSLRLKCADAAYHATFRGNEKKAVFKSDQDRVDFLNTLQQVNKRYNWICRACRLMDNQYHLLIETPDGNLAIGMRQLNGVRTQPAALAAQPDRPHEASKMYVSIAKSFVGARVMSGLGINRRFP